MTDIQTALTLLAPGAQWSCRDDDYNQITWYSEDIPKPSLAEVNAKIEELKAAEPMRLLRIERDKLLAEVDWVTIRSYNQGVPIPEEWVAYCQALRDLPETATPILDLTNLTGVSGVTWPVKPT